MFLCIFTPCNDSVFRESGFCQHCIYTAWKICLNSIMSDLVMAVRELRAALGDTLQAFATRLGMSISAIANYEGGRDPSGKALYKLERLAMAQGRHDLALVFARALAHEMDWAQEP